MTVEQYRKRTKKIDIEKKIVNDDTICEETECVEKSVCAYVETIKVFEDERKITGVVLRPNVFDAQQTTISENVIREAAHKFLSGYNKKNTMGLQHEEFDQPIELCESVIAPVDMIIGNSTITKGTWYIVSKINDKKLWEKIKKRELTGYSIGGKAKIKKLEKEEEVD